MKFYLESDCITKSWIVKKLEFIYSLKNINISIFFRCVQNICINNIIFFNFCKITKRVCIYSCHRYKQLGKLLLELYTLPGIINIVYIHPISKSFFRMELCSKNWVSFFFDRWYKSSPIWHKTMRSDIPEIFHILVLLESIREYNKVATVLS